MSPDVDTLTSQSDVSVNSAVAQGSHKGGGTVVHPGQESLALSTATLLYGLFYIHSVMMFSKIFVMSWTFS